MGDDRLSDLAVINIHRAVAKQLNINSIIDHFAKSKCKISFTYHIITYLFDFSFCKYVYILLNK